MNKKGVTIIEVIAVLVIITCLVIIFIPKTTETIEVTKKSEYISEVKDIVDKAKIMYQDSKYLNDTNYFVKNGDSHVISLAKIEGIKDYVDPFGYLYDKTETFITFIKNNNTTDIRVNVKSCDMNLSDKIYNCYEIVDESYDNLTENSVKNTVH